MYGLPAQTTREVARSAELAASLAPQRLALFGYAHVPWFKTHQRLIDEAALPGLSERLQQAQVAAETLGGLGYQAVGLDHFALPDDELAVAAREQRLHRNFQGYTVDDADALIPLGATAIGKLPQGFVQNAPDVAGYARAVAGGKFATVKGIALSDDDRLRAGDHRTADVRSRTRSRDGRGRAAALRNGACGAACARRGRPGAHRGRAHRGDGDRPAVRAHRGRRVRRLSGGQGAKRHSVAV